MHSGFAKFTVKVDLSHMGHKPLAEPQQVWSTDKMRRSAGLEDLS
jgi:hypothetical protein